MHKIFVLPLVLYECEISSLALRERQVESVGKQDAEENFWTEGKQQENAENVVLISFMSCRFARCY
jgi:hypothetical protein